ncbi:hypothetical protein [Brevibacillus centrosporus]|uniref:hypothetical protein n=1 Tax=Brevibacillus centrosporus TaxID=54910 RepID=UPI002E1DCBC3|nr:hypothetical protein [Brevibacillus centrosporus]
MSTQFAAGANSGVFIEVDGEKIYAIQSHRISESETSRHVHGYGSEESIGQTSGARQHTITLETAVALEYPEDTVPLYILLRQPGTEVVRYIGKWKTVFTGLRFSNYDESGNLESANESITLTSTKRQDFFNGKPVSLNTALSALGG